MATILFSKAHGTNLIDENSNDVTAPGCVWLLTDENVDRASDVTQVVEQGGGLDIIDGEGTLVITAPVGKYGMVIQPAAGPAIAAYQVEAI